MVLYHIFGCLGIGGCAAAGVLLWGYTVGMVFRFTRRQLVLFGVLCFLVVCLAFVPHTASAVGIGEGITKVVNAVVGGLMKALEWILGLFQFLFLQVIEFTILDFAKNWNDGGFLSDFRVVWQVLRDLVNLIIVVLFVITAMMTSLGKEQFGFHRKGLLHLIAAAVFVNFSAFFTLLVIDISHILFMLFFNALDASSWGSFSPFSGYSVVLGDVSTGMFNLILGVIAIVVNWFILLGILYFCIILIERYIIAMFLVLLSPLAALGFFASMSGGNPLASKFIGIYTQWKEKLGYVFSMPVVLILGFTLLLVLFRGALGELVDPENFVKLIGVGTSEGRGILLQLIMASIVLILGIFKVGEVAKKANIHPAIAGKFKFGEIAGKLVGPKAQLGLLRSLKNPASRGIGNYKQKIYNKRDQWRKEGSVLAKIPGVGKELDIGGKVRRAGQAARTIASGVDAVAGGKSARDISFQSAEAKEDKRVWDIIRTGTRDQKENLLKQALNPKSKVALNEQQTAELARNSDLHPLLSSLNKGVSQSTFRQIYKDATNLGKEVSLREKESTEEGSLPHNYLSREQARDAAVVDFERAEVLHKDLTAQKNVAQKEYDEARAIFEQTDVYKGFKDDVAGWEADIADYQKKGNAQKVAEMEKGLKDYKENFYSTTAVADPSGLAMKNKQSALQGMERELQDAGATKRSAHKKQQRAERDFAAVEGAYRHNVRKRERENTKDRKRVVQILSNVATNTAAGSVSGSAAVDFSPEELEAVRERREQMTAGTQKMFAAMKNDYAQSSSVDEEMLKAEEKTIEEQNEEGNTKLADKKSEYYEEEAKNPNSNILTPSMQQLQKEIDTLESAAADRHKRSLEIDEKKKRIDEIRNSFEEKDITDARKLEILGQSTSHMTSFMQEGTQYLADQLQSVTDRIDTFEQNAQASGIDLNSSDDYADLQQEQSQAEERLNRISGIGRDIDAVKGSLDEQEEIIASAAYKKVSDREQYLAMFSIKALLGDVGSALERRKKEFEEDYQNKQKAKTGTAKKPPKNAYKDDPEWKALDQWKKNLEKIQKEGGASPELQQEAMEAVKKASSKKKSSR